jgi:predicted nucleic acid-binding protein
VGRRLSDFERCAKARKGWLIDTNIISATIGNRPLHTGVAHFFESVPDERLRLSALTIGEIRKGIEMLEVSAADKRRVLERKLEDVKMLWSDRILPIDFEVAERWGHLAAHYQQRGQAVPAIDGLIAATAYVHNLVVVSHDSVFARMTEHIIVYDPIAN